MNDDQINFRILFRSPKYPVIVIDDDGLWSASNIEELGTICVMSKPGDDDGKLKVIDTTGEEFWYMPEQYALAPGFSFRKWTKKQIIELFNTSETAKEENIHYPLKSLSNKKLSKIVTDICVLLSHLTDQP
jgi:hypothetical protein